MNPIEFQILTTVVGALIGFLVHHIIFGRIIMSQLDELTAAQTAVSTGIEKLIHTLADMQSANAVAKVHGNTPDLTGFIEATQKQADDIATAVGMLYNLRAPIADVDAAPSAPVDDSPLPTSDANAPDDPSAAPAETVDGPPAVQAPVDAADIAPVEQEAPLVGEPVVDTTAATDPPTPDATGSVDSTIAQDAPTLADTSAEAAAETPAAAPGSGAVTNDAAVAATAPVVENAPEAAAAGQLGTDLPA
jgi:hypothetical protein